MKCFTCGNEFTDKGGRGRKRDYCSDNCCNFNKYKNAMIKCIESISFSTEMNKQLRGDLFRLANEVKQRETK